MGLDRATILIVEDEPSLVIGLTKVLTKLGYSICGNAETAEKAVEMAGEFHPDIILMDIELKGALNGIDAAEKIRAKYRIPVIYLTGHSENHFVDKAKITEPFGYILKPLRVKELRTTIEIALYKHAMELKQEERSSQHTGNNTLFLKKAQNGITLLLYNNEVNRFSLFKHVLEDCISDNCECLYAFYNSPLISYFAHSISRDELRIFELREGTYIFDQWFEQIRSSSKRQDPRKNIFCIADISNVKNPEVLLHIKEKFVEADKETGSMFSGILAVPLDEQGGFRREDLYDGVSNFIVLSEKENIVSFSPSSHLPPSANVVSQEIMDNVVKKSLDVLILSCLQRPVTGFDIIHEINERFHVAIPIARIYTYLYELEKKGVLTTILRGRSRIYSPTKEGEVYIRDRLSEISTAYNHVLGVKR